MPLTLLKHTPWALCIALAIATFYFFMQTQTLSALNTGLKSDNARMVDQRNAVIEVNHAMHNTVVQLQNQLESARKIDDWFNALSGTMDTKLKSAITDIKRITHEQTPSTAKSCNFRYSSAVSQRMRDVYSGKADSVQE